MANEENYQIKIVERQKTFEVSAFVTTYYFTSKPKFEARWEKYPFSQIFLILEGSGTYTTENASYPFSAGMMLYRPAGKASIYEWNSENVRFGLVSLVCRSDRAAAYFCQKFGGGLLTNRAFRSII